MTTALIAEDEPLMLSRISDLVNQVWPELEIVARCKNGEEALAAFHQHRPDVAFLDIRMPGKTGLEVAAVIGDAAHIVFVTAYDEYAIAAFESGAADYLLKPVELSRLTEAVQRLRKRIGATPPAPPADLTLLVKSLLEQAKPVEKLRWIRAAVGNATRLIHVDDVLFFQSDTKYTRIVLKESEALVRIPLKELIEGLDTDVFWQVHRGSIVNAHVIDRAVREGPEKLTLHIKGSTERVAVSRQYFHLFKQT
ncbi:MAG: response regulator transcription factor [Aeromicrobium sp.]|nr:response regulator transcription factor [Burkholderiales bacterium]